MSNVQVTWDAAKQAYEVIDGDGKTWDTIQPFDVALEVALRRAKGCGVDIKAGAAQHMRKDMLL